MRGTSRLLRRSDETCYFACRCSSSRRGRCPRVRSCGACTIRVKPYLNTDRSSASRTISRSSNQRLRHSGLHRNRQFESQLPGNDGRVQFRSSRRFHLLRASDTRWPTWGAGVSVLSESTPTGPRFNDYALPGIGARIRRPCSLSGTIETRVQASCGLKSGAARLSDKSVSPEHGLRFGTRGWASRCRPFEEALRWIATHGHHRQGHRRLHRQASHSEGRG